MNITRTLLFISCMINLLAGHILLAQTEEIASMQELVHYINPQAKTLVIFDIDNTLAMTPQELGSDEWFHYEMNKHIANGVDYLHALHVTLPTLFLVQFSTPLVSTEQCIPDVVASLNAQNIQTMALTARSLYIAERTVEQLEGLRITFNAPDVHQERFALPLAMPSIYSHGILFSGENDKGVALLCFLDAVNCHPEHIVFVDDKMKNLQAVEEALIARQIHYTCIRYTHCDEKAKNYDPQKAKEQLAQLREERNTITIEL